MNEEIYSKKTGSSVVIVKKVFPKEHRSMFLVIESRDGTIPLMSDTDMNPI